jgi:hypothetical protein
VDAVSYRPCIRSRRNTRATQERRGANVASTGRRYRPDQGRSW